MREYIQNWHRFTRYIINSEGGSIQIELYSTPQDKHGTTAYIHSLWVEEPYRRRGVAKLLLTRAEEVAKSQGHEAAYLEWNERDTPGEVLQHLYLNNGYEKVVASTGYALLKKRLK